MDSITKLHLLLENTKLRLKNKYGWDEDFINLAVSEYGRYLYLCKNNPKMTIVPGKVVDEVWHDHILHTRDYIAYCTSEFGEYLHHDPKQVKSGKNNDITPTIELYTQTFGHAPPKKIWLDEVKKYDTKPEKTQSNTFHNCCRCGS